MRGAQARTSPCEAIAWPVGEKKKSRHSARNQKLLGKPWMRTGSFRSAAALLRWPLPKRKWLRWAGCPSKTGLGQRIPRANFRWSPPQFHQAPRNGVEPTRTLGASSILFSTGPNYCRPECINEVRSNQADSIHALVILGLRVQPLQCCWWTFSLNMRSKGPWWRWCRMYCSIQGASCTPSVWTSPDMWQTAYWSPAASLLFFF